MSAAVTNCTINRLAHMAHYTLGRPLQASFPKHYEVWQHRQLAAESGLDPSELGPLQTGLCMEHEQASQIPVAIGKDLLMDYAQTVFDLCEKAMQGLKDDDLLKPRISIVQLDFSISPPGETEGKEAHLLRDLDFHKGHVDRHLGMIEGLIGVMFDREGTATM